MSGAPVCTAVTLKLVPGQEGAYREWLAGPATAQTAPIYARTGVTAKTVLLAGPRLIAHYEATRPGAVEEAYATPEAAAIMAGQLKGIVDESVAPVVYPEVFAWQVPPPWPVERAGLLLNVQAGAEERYLDWLTNRAVGQLAGIWERAEINRHDVLMTGNSIVAFYETKMRYYVLKAFRDPEALAILFSDLATLLDLDPTMPMSLFEEAYHWQAGA